MFQFPEPLEFLTYKSGKFHFYSYFDINTINQLLVEIKTIFNILKNIPLTPEINNKLKVELIKKSIFSTAAIEGNPLKENEVDEILNNNVENNKFNQNKSKQEILNLKTLYDKLVNANTENILISENQIKEYHYIITNNIDYQENSPGNYRNTKVVVGDNDHGGIYRPPVILEDIINLMKKYIEFINSDSMLKTEPLLRPAYAHFYLAMIHPFRDGNGRTSRFVEAWLLSKYGYHFLAPILSNYYYNNIDTYYSVFSETRKEKNMTSFFKFYLKACISSLKFLSENINTHIYKIIFLDHINNLKNNNNISLRQKTLLEFIFEDSQPISLNLFCSVAKYKLLYSNISTETIRRDLKKLKEIGILKQIDKNTYSINTNHFIEK